LGTRGRATGSTCAHHPSSRKYLHANTSTAARKTCADFMVLERGPIALAIGPRQRPCFTPGGPPPPCHGTGAGQQAVPARQHQHCCKENLRRFHGPGAWSNCLSNWTTSKALFHSMAMAKEHCRVQTPLGQDTFGLPRFLLPTKATQSFFIIPARKS